HELCELLKVSGEGRKQVIQCYDADEAPVSVDHRRSAYRARGQCLYPFRKAHVEWQDERIARHHIPDSEAIEVRPLGQLAAHYVPISQNSLRSPLRIVRVQDHECADMTLSHHARGFSQGSVRIGHGDVWRSDVTDDHTVSSCA